ncbi:MAG: hypothetical protein ACRDSK_14715 [Actinophytocola sp.]|uniref:hypothetical protein n=1 Tax=Actinophytocola sp. TaxID=1872138 RepID=UPI003D6A4499
MSAARSGAGGCLVLRGETGMGKTAPLAALDRLLPGLDLTGVRVGSRHGVPHPGQHRHRRVRAVSRHHDVRARE